MNDKRATTSATALPPSPGALAQAAEWFVLFASGDASQAEYDRWHAWRAALPEHEQAWQRTEQRMAGFSAIPATQRKLAAQTLRAAATRPASRRRFLAQLGVLLAVGGSGGWMLSRGDSPTGQISTAIGEQRELQLADGGQLVLDTDSAVRIDYTAESRSVHLQRGQVWIETAPDALRRPFVVITREGKAEALGTRFTVSQENDATRIAVLAQRVAMHSADASARPVILLAGQTARFGRHGLIAQGSADSADATWSTGMLVADAMPLGEFVSRLARYRASALRCAPEVADLPISGAFPLRDTERTLAAVVATLPVRRVLDGESETLVRR